VSDFIWVGFNALSFFSLSRLDWMTEHPAHTQKTCHGTAKEDNRGGLTQEQLENAIGMEMEAVVML